MNNLTKEQLEQIVESICSEIPESHYSMWYFGDAIRNNNLEHLFTENQMSVFDECELNFQDENEYNDDEDDSGNDKINYEVRRSYPWSSGSWTEDENSIEKGLKEEVTRVVKLVLENEN